MTVRVYKSTDANAPVISGTSPTTGMFSDLFKKCLCTGYGAKIGAGWTLTIDNVGKKLFRNVGSGRYFRVKDDGYPQATTVTPDYKTAVITGAINYSDIDTLITPFPRTVTGTDLHSTTWYGVPINIGTYDSIKWTVKADENTCYLIIPYGNSNQDATSPLVSVYGSQVVYAFGDLKPLGGVTSNPKAFVQTTSFTNDIFNDKVGSFGVTGQICGYMEHCLYDSTKATRFYVNSGFGQSAMTFVSNGQQYQLDDNLVVFPNPVTGGALLERYLISDDATNIVRPLAHRIASGNPVYEKFATYAGVYGCLHGLRSQAGATSCGMPFDTLNDGNRQYMVFDTLNFKTLAIDITGPW